MEDVVALRSKTIYEILMPTFKIFTPLLQAQSSSITAIPRETHSYGAHPRQKVDVYSPPTSPPQPPAPIFIFLYGGSLTGGDRILPAAAVPDNLVYANLGAFFASRGFITLIPDYRRVNDSHAGTGEDAIYPSGAEDIASVLAWVDGGGVKHLQSGSGHGQNSDGSRSNVFVVGNSAGGIHLATWLLAPQFEAARRLYLSNRTRTRLSGAVLISVPFHFKNAGAARGDALRAYYGEAVGQKCPFGLLEDLKATRSGEKRLALAELGIPSVLNLEGQLDPEDEILAPGRDFVALWREVFGAQDMEDGDLEGHNHISPPVALMSGDMKGERWGEDLVRWMRIQMKK